MAGQLTEIINGVLHIYPSRSKLNDNWLKSGRLLRAGKTKELKKRESIKLTSLGSEFSVPENK